MSDIGTFTVVDINAGLGGRARVFRDMGFGVLAALENDKTYHSAFCQLSPDIPLLDASPTVQNLDQIPKADIITANISPLKFYPTNRRDPHSLQEVISKLIMRDAPKAFVFQASSLMLRSTNFRFLSVEAMRRYVISYQLFKEADYSGYPTAGRQLYIVGIRSDIYVGDFIFPPALRRDAALINILERPDAVDSWYRRLPSKLYTDHSLEVDTIYTCNSKGELMRSDRLTQSAFAESYYCDEYGLRRLTHREYAIIKGYDPDRCDFNQYPNRRAMYRMLFAATNTYLFAGIVGSLLELLHSFPGSLDLRDWPGYTVPAAEEKPQKATKPKIPAESRQASGEKLIFPKLWLRSIHIDRLKGLRSLDISFSDTLTAIMGVNGSGKSTVLHALACIFQPFETGQDHKFNFFFTPNPDAQWNDSSFSILYEDENTKTEISRHYRKKSDRWTPKYANRPRREVYYMGIDSCPPEIEKERQTSYISYSTDKVDGRQSEHIREALSHIMDKTYTEITSNKTRKKTMIGVCTSDDIRYSALSMGAGEQRVFKILQLVFTAPAFSLILIDEIDLLLHTKALERLIKKLSQIAQQRKLQIVFTTHSLTMRKLTDYVAIRYLYQTKEKTMLFDTITPDIVYDLANETERPLTVYVEDDLAAAIVSGVMEELSLTRRVVLKMIGSSENAFTLAAGLVLQEDARLSNKLIVLDGDVYRTQEEREKRIIKSLSGTETDHNAKVQTALSVITQLNLPENTKPEPYIHTMILENGPISDKANEILYCASQINTVDDPHQWVDGIVAQMNQERNITLYQIVQDIMIHRDWRQYTENVCQWLKAKKEELNL